MPSGNWMSLVFGILAWGTTSGELRAAAPAVAEKSSTNELTEAQFYAERPGNRFDVRENLPYAAPGGVELLLDAYVPKLSGLLPAVLIVHGGAWRSGSKGQLRKYARDLAARGYVTFAINYRLAPTHQFPAQLEDCQTALQWIRRHANEYKVDPERIGAMGYSAGGHLAALLGVTGHAGDPKHPETDTRLAAVCAGGAPCDFREVNPEARGLSFWLGGSRGQVPQQYLKASPLAFVTRQAPPMFFYNGLNDLLVEPDSAKAMALALKALGVDAEFVPLAGMGHLFAAIHAPTIEKAYEFLDRHLKPKTSAHSE